MSSVPYSQMAQASLIWETIDQVKADLSNAQCNQKGGIVIRGVTYPVEEIVNRIYAFKPGQPGDCCPEYHKVGATMAYLNVANIFRNLVNQNCERGKYCLARYFECCVCTSSCKRALILGDSYLTVERIYGSNAINDYQTFSKLESQSNTTPNKAPEQQTMTTQSV